MALRRGLKNRVRIGRKLVPVRNRRRIGKHDMVLNNDLPKIEVDSESFILMINGEIAETKPSRTPKLSRYTIYYDVSK
jgi:urease subunit alpha